MPFTELLGLDFLAGCVHVLAVRRGWWIAPSLIGLDHRKYKARVYWNGMVEWTLK
jgi:hypothetical protein